MSSQRLRVPGAVFLVAAVGAVAAYTWLKAPYGQPEAVAVATAFVELMQSGRFEEALDLTSRRNETGRTAPALRAAGARNLCPVRHVRDVHPPQSNGNRLRRRLQGMPLDLPEVWVEFDGTCPVGVTVRRDASGVWKVHRFSVHAG